MDHKENNIMVSKKNGINNSINENDLTMYQLSLIENFLNGLIKSNLKK